MSIIDTSSNRVRQAQETVTSVVEARSRDAKALFSLLPTPGNGLLDPSDLFEQSARLTKRLVEVNVDYIRDLATAVRKHISGLVGVVKDEVQTTAGLANSQADELEEAAAKQAREIELAERREVRRANKAAHDAAAEKYQDMTKVELSDELEKRNLVKSGNVDELRLRLIENDLQVTP